MLAVYLSPVYIVVNSYLLIRIHRWLSTCSPLFGKIWMRILISLAYSFLAVSILIAFFLPIGPVKRMMEWISNYWLGVLLYLILIVLTMDVVCLLHFFIMKWKLYSSAQRFANLLASALRKHLANWQIFGQINMLWSIKCRSAMVGGICAGIVLALSAWGAYNARIIHVTPYDITVNKDGGKLGKLNVVLAADLHLGYNIGTAHIIQMVDKINEQDADLVVIAGDIFDNEYEALDDPAGLIAVLQKIQSKYGVYACYGNHDVEEKILAGFTFGENKKKESSIQMDEFLDKAGIHLLRDEAVLIDDSFYLYGRPDAQRPGRGINKRKTAAELMEGLDTQRPVIVIDHQPKELQELADAGVDVDLGGHTHDGQMFPANLVTALMWENSYGYLKKGRMHTVVTSGVGLFGPNMRVGTVAEICPITIHFQPQIREALDARLRKRRITKLHDIS